MKKAAGWIILSIGALCLVFFAGLFIGRSSLRSPDISSSSKLSSSAVSNASNFSKVNINSANSQQLQQLPGIGEVLAQRIIAYRLEHGPFSSIQDLEKVDGIGAGKMIELLELITVEELP